ncbi:MAG: chemotaxis protein CheW [Myxococcales bacterium]|jgi:purine-binding chemotaxis protein CheW
MSEAMAQRSGDALADEAATREFLGFELAAERYALPLSSVREIVRVPAVTEVPRSPGEVLGIFSVRGTVTTLVDLRRKLRMREGEETSRSRVLLVDRGNEVIGLLVDAVLQVFRLREDEVELAAVLGSEASAYVMGIGRPGSSRAHVGGKGPAGGDGELLILLDPIGLLKAYG